MGDLLGLRNDPPDLGESVGYSDRFEVRRHEGLGDDHSNPGELLTAHYTDGDAQRQLERVVAVVAARGGQASLDGSQLRVTESDGTQLTYRIHRA